MPLLLHDLTSFDIIMIKISDISYGITVSIGLTNGIRRNAKITKIEMEEYYRVEY